MSVSYVSKKKMFTFQNFVNACDKPPKGTDVRKMLLYKSNHEIAVKKRKVEKVLYFSNTFFFFVCQTTYALMCVVLCTCKIKMCNCNTDSLQSLENTLDHMCIHSEF